MPLGNWAQIQLDWGASLPLAKGQQGNLHHKLNYCIRGSAENQILLLTKPVKNDSKYTCVDYREEMTILGLKRRLKDENISEEEKQAIILEIRKLESLMQID
jgi:hypothetical protein